MHVSKKLREAVSPSLCVHTKWRDFGKSADEKNMGGIGSSRWSPGYQRRETVENSTALSVKDFYRTGVLKKGERWLAPDLVAKMRHDGGGLWIIVRGTDIDDPKIWTKLRTAEGAIVKQEVRIEIIPARDGMHRLWFRCPLTAHSRCGGRVETLYLPPLGSALGCRKCHRLTYQSVLKYDQLRPPRGVGIQGKNVGPPCVPTDPPLTR